MWESRCGTSWAPFRSVRFLRTESSVEEGGSKHGFTLCTSMVLSDSLLGAVFCFVDFFWFFLFIKKKKKLKVMFSQWLRLNRIDYFNRSIFGLDCHRSNGSFYRRVYVVNIQYSQQEQTPRWLAFKNKSKIRFVFLFSNYHHHENDTLLIRTQTWNYNWGFCFFFKLPWPWKW